MGNIATDINKQIEILTSRNMDFDMEKTKVEEILLDIGYYRLGFYWHPFEIDIHHRLKKGTKFSSVINLYYLDVELRRILTKYLNRIELNFRTKLIYHVSNKYKESPIWFVDKNIISKDFIKNFNSHYNDSFIKKNKILKTHHKKYINDKYAPAWKTLELFTFGVITKIYKSLEDKNIKEKISKLYGIENPSKFINLFDTIVYVRNRCAHNNVMFDLKLPKSISSFSEIKFNSSKKHDLDSCIKVILYIIEKISTNRKKEMEADINDLFKSYKDSKVIQDIIKNKIGYRFK